jgi:CheY-like chemotaxis protein
MPLDLPEEMLAQRVLLVDDEEVVRDVLRKLLAREPDLSIDEAESAEEAAKLLARQRYDVLLTDKNLPGKSGLELIREAMRLRPMLEAMIITGYPSADSVVEALAAGACDYLVKPFDDLQLVRAKVRAALERRSEGVQRRRAARALAQEAVALLQGGKDAPEATWRALEEALKIYEASAREGLEGGRVAVVGPLPAGGALASLPATVVTTSLDDEALDGADVVVFGTDGHDWREAAERLTRRPFDVVLVAGADLEVSDLLEALALKLELVGMGRDPTRELPERVRGILLRRAVERAQGELGRALEAFRSALQGLG